MHSAPLTRETIENADCVLVVTDHKAIDWQLIAKHAKLVVDSRNAMAPFQPIAGHYVPA